MWILPEVSCAGIVKRSWTADKFISLCQEYNTFEVVE
jgi:hypothetical protein